MEKADRKKVVLERDEILARLAGLGSEISRMQRNEARAKSGESLEVSTANSRALLEQTSLATMVARRDALRARLAEVEELLSA